MSGLFGLGIALLAMGFGAVIAPGSLVRDSRRNHQRRLKELEDGAPEAYFEEKRDLESYQPRFDFSEKTIRRLGGVALVLGAAALFLGSN